MHSSRRMQFLDCAPSLVHGLVGVSRSSVRVSDRDPSKSLACEFAGLSPLGHSGSKDSYIRKRIHAAAIHGDCRDVAPDRSAIAQDARKLITDTRSNVSNGVDNKSPRPRGVDRAPASLKARCPLHAPESVPGFLGDS